MRVCYPRFSMRTLLLATALVAAATPMLITLVKSRLSKDGAVIFGDSSEPSDNETRLSLRKLGYMLPSESVGVYQENSLTMSIQRRKFRFSEGSSVTTSTNDVACRMDKIPSRCQLLLPSGPNFDGSNSRKFSFVRP
jgi:hypothetical protein